MSNSKCHHNTNSEPPQPPPTDWKPSQRHPNAKAIASGLDIIPPHCALTPLQAKQPKRPGWQNETPLSHEQIASIILNGEIKTSEDGRRYRLYASGFGIRTGNASGGILAIDVDGPEAAHLFDMISGGSLPETVAFTSGKKGRRQLLFQIPLDVQGKLESFTRKALREYAGCKISQDLDFRYNDSQSCLPPSFHPDTGSYRWITSPAECEVATAPDWLIELLLGFADEAAREKEERDRTQAEQLAKRAEIRQQSSFQGAPVPLEKCIAISNREALEHGAGQGERDNRGAALARDLYGTAAALDGLGIPFEGDPRSLLEEYAARCSPPLQIRDINRIDKSAQRRGPTASLSDDALIACAKAWEYRQKFPNASPSGHFSSTDGIGRSLIDLIRKAKESPYKFQKIGIEDAQPITPSSIEADPDTWIYEEGDRLDVWRDGVASGYKVILDKSGTGTGKSHTVGLATPEDFGAKRIWYISNDHRNPTAAPIRGNFTDLEGRHNGLTRDYFGKYRRIKPGEDLAVAGNCVRVEAIAQLRNKNIPGADSANAICMNCPVLEQCKSGATHINYRHQRASILDEKNGPDRISAHPSSLPSPDEYDYSNDVLVIDEAEQAIAFSREIRVGREDLAKSISALAVQQPELFLALHPTISTVSDLIDGTINQPNKYGFSHHSLLDLIPPAYLNLDEAFELSAFEDLSEEVAKALDTTDEYGVPLADLPPQIRKRFADNASDSAEKIKALRKVWLGAFLEVLGGARGHLSLSNGELIISIPDERMGAICAAAKSVIALDATHRREKLALSLGVEGDDILVAKQVDPKLDNLERLQVATLGRLGMNRGEDQKNRLAILREAIASKAAEEGKKIGFVDFKKFAEIGDLRHFIESRGSNDFQDLDELVINGIPTPSLTALKAQFAILYGYAPTDETITVRREIKLSNELPDGIEGFFESKESADPKFADFVRECILAERNQTEGRLRANLRPDQKLKITYLTDFAFDVPVKLVRAVDICPEAGTKGQRIQAAIFAHIRKLANLGKLTRDGLAEAIATSTGNLSRILKELGYKDFKDFKASSLLLYKALIAKVTRGKSTQKKGWMVDRLASLAKVDVARFLAEAISFTKVIHKHEGSDRSSEFLQSLPSEALDILLAELMGILPLSTQRALIREMGVRLC